MKKNLPWIMAGVLVACVVIVILSLVRHNVQLHRVLLHEHCTPESRQQQAGSVLPETGAEHSPIAV